MPLCAFLSVSVHEAAVPGYQGDQVCAKKKKKRDERKNTSENGKVSQLNAALVHRLKNVS